MGEVALRFVTYYEKQQEIAYRFTSVRKIRKITQRRIADISGVPYATVRRFEKTGDISFASFIKLMIALRLYDDLDNLIDIKKEYRSIDDVIKENKRFEKYLLKKNRN